MVKLAFRCRGCSKIHASWARQGGALGSKSWSRLAGCWLLCCRLVACFSLLLIRVFLLPHPSCTMSRRWWATPTLLYHLATCSPATAASPATAVTSACELSTRTNGLSHLAWLPAPLVSNHSRTCLQRNNHRAFPVPGNSRKRPRPFLGRVVSDVGSGRRRAECNDAYSGTAATGAGGNSIGCTLRGVRRWRSYGVPGVFRLGETALSCAKDSDGCVC